MQSNCIALQLDRKRLDTWGKDESFISSRLYFPTSDIIEDNYGFTTSSEIVHAKSIEITVKNHLVAELDDINLAIKESSYLYSLEEGWDGAKAKKIPTFLLERAFNFLRNYAEYLFDLYNFKLIAPNISPLSDGSIDLEWRTPSCILLINFKNTQDDIAYYYGELIEEKEKFNVNGEISTRSPLSTFALWLKNLK